MNILFMTMSKMSSVETKGIYTDLMRKFRDEGHKVYLICPTERRDGLKTACFEQDGVHVLRVRTLNVQKTNPIEKGVGQLLIETLYKQAFKRYYESVRFDLVLYSTPPITFPSVISYAKQLNPDAQTYLMLKDIFPQNAVDLGMMSQRGAKGVLYRFFRAKEKRLYQLSDYIGCMSPANVNYVLAHNPEVDAAKVELAPNSYESVSYVAISDDAKAAVRQKYNLPLDKPIFLYGGNLGKPQGIPFLLDCLKANCDRSDCHFVVIGGGTEFPKIEKWVKENAPKNVSLFSRIPKEDYDVLADACDIGLIFLDYRFTIPNYPSRLLPYLMSKKPIIAATDPNCDTGALAEANGYGYYCPSNDVDGFTAVVDKMLHSDLSQMGENGYQFFLNNYTVQHTYGAIMQHMQK